MINTYITCLIHWYGNIHITGNPEKMYLWINGENTRSGNNLELLLKEEFETVPEFLRVLYEKSVAYDIQLRERMSCSKSSLPSHL